MYNVAQVEKGGKHVEIRQCLLFLTWAKIIGYTFLDLSRPLRAKILEVRKNDNWNETIYSKYYLNQE